MQSAGGPDQRDPWAPPDAAPPTAGQPPAAAAAPPQPQPGWGGTTWDGSPWGAPPAPDPQARRRRRRAVLALGSVAVVLVALVGLSQLVEQRRTERLQARVDAALPSLVQFVEDERGLVFLEPVEVEVLDDDAFLEALYAPSPSDPEPRDDRDAERTLVALGLLDAGVDLDEAVTDSLDEGVVGLYDPVDGRLVVRGREVDAFARLVLVHELAHALQDQHFDLDRPELDETDDERGLAFTSLVEGDAVRVEQAWLEAQPSSVQRELAELFSTGGPSGGEPVVEALLGFPYLAGPGLVEGLLAGGGQPALDAAFREPPASTEQVLDPAAPTPVEVERPDAGGGEIVDEGVLGRLGLALLLGTDPLAPGSEQAWAADRYVTVETDGQTCTDVRIAVDDVSGGDRLRRALDEQAGLDVAAEPGGTLLLQSCAD